MHNILIELVIPTKLESLIICLNEIFNTVQVDKPLSDTFPIKNVLKQGNIYRHYFLKFVLEYGIRRVQVKQNGWKLIFFLFVYN